ncbi:hypothetical protein Y981_10495 [Leptospirillum ferriphilum YSK]|uniref:Uncharacterized protein n=1 Tax=Leptospirillum ferriphilum YSK TaxID=1441628 RepID=A0A059Y343_9BACT|nr:hypothetical protein Y981_10495 [Leptospirillum ferriphilum YSK]
MSSFPERHPEAWPVPPEQIPGSKTQFLTRKSVYFSGQIVRGKKRVSFPSEVKEFGISEKRTGRIL